MTFATLALGVVVMMSIVSAAEPALVARRTETFEQQQLDEVARGLPYTHVLAFPACAALLAAVAAGSGFVLGYSTWPVWSLVAVVAVVLLGLMRRARTCTEALVRERGAIVPAPGSAQAEHTRRQLRLMTVAYVLFSLSWVGRLLARHDALAWLLAPTALATISSLVVVALLGWRAMRGPAPEPDASPPAR